MRVGPSAPSRGVSPSNQGRATAPQPRTFLEVLREGQHEAPVPAPQRPSPSPVVRGIAQIVQRVGAGEAHVDALLEAAARGKTFTAAELIAMQATVFRYSQTVEVLSRATDKVVGAVKQTLGTQI